MRNETFVGGTAGGCWLLGCRRTLGCLESGLELGQLARAASTSTLGSRDNAGFISQASRDPQSIHQYYIDPKYALKTHPSTGFAGPSFKVERFKGLFSKDPYHCLFQQESKAQITSN